MTVLCYHSIQDDWTSPLAVATETFEEHCGWLAAHRQVLPLHAAIERMDASWRLPRGVATLTFDDGFAALYDHALPGLARHRLPATVFLVAQTLTPAGQEVDWVDTAYGQHLTTLTIEQVREMQAAGVTFESHSFAHLDLTQLGFDRCVRDLRDSRELLESLLGHPVRLLAYPRGRHDDVVRVAAQQAGYTHAFTLPEGPEPVGPYAIPRVGLFRGNGVRNLQVKAARSYLPLRTGRSYGIAQQLRRSLPGRRP